MSLNILTDSQVQEYLAGLDLAEGSEAYRTLNSMLVLPAGAFARAVSAIAQGLFDFAAVRALPAMNERLVDALIASRLGEDDPTTLAWRYREQWLPASIDLAALRSGAVGDPQRAIAAKFFDRWGGVIRPAYDFLRTDETKFHSYAEAYVGYMVIANSAVPAGYVAGFAAAHAALRNSHPQLLHPSDAACPILALVQSLLAEAVFLERPTGGRVARPLLDWVVGASWRTVFPGNFQRFMAELAYPAMAAADDPARTGEPGMVDLFDAHPWEPLAASTDPGWALDVSRMARIHLPEAYGADVSDQRDVDAAALAYLEAARSAILKFHDYVAREMGGSAIPYRVVPGSPSGLLLCITFP